MITAVLSVAVAGAASAAIVPGVGIAGLKLGVSAAQARQVLGKPIAYPKLACKKGWLGVPFRSSGL